MTKAAGPAVLKRDNVILAALTIGVGLIAAFMVQRGSATLIEAVAFVSGAICVWLTVKGSVWNFPLGLINVGTYFFVFWRARIYGDMSLQVVYFVMNAMGWYMWLFGGERRTALVIRHSGKRELAIVGIAIPIVSVALWQALHAVGGAASLADAVTTSISLGAQWLMNRKLVENWYLWIVADILYVPLYIHRDLQLTAVLYVVFLVMASMGLFEWKAVVKERERG